MIGDPPYPRPWTAETWIGDPDKVSIYDARDLHVADIVAYTPDPDDDDGTLGPAYTAQALAAFIIDAVHRTDILTAPTTTVIILAVTTP